MRYVLGADPQSFGFKIWNSDTLDFERSLSGAVIKSKLIENENSFANAKLKPTENTYILDRKLLTNKEIYGKLYEKTIVCGSINLMLIDNTYLVLENHSGIYISPVNQQMNRCYLPVYQGGIFQVMKDDTYTQKFSKTKYSLLQLKRFSLLGGWEKVYNEYRRAYEEYKLYSSFSASPSVEILNGGLDVCF